MARIRSFQERDEGSIPYLRLTTNVVLDTLVVIIVS